MLRNYLIVAWRNLLRHKLYTAINVGGLAVALSVVVGHSLRAALANPVDALRYE